MVSDITHIRSPHFIAATIVIQLPSSHNAEAQLPPEARQRFGRSTAAICWAKI